MAASTDLTETYLRAAHRLWGKLPIRTPRIQPPPSDMAPMRAPPSPQIIQQEAILFIGSFSWHTSCSRTLTAYVGAGIGEVV